MVRLYRRFKGSSQSRGPRWCNVPEGLNIQPYSWVLVLLWITLLTSLKRFILRTYDFLLNSAPCNIQYLFLHTVRRFYFYACCTHRQLPMAVPSMLKKKNTDINLSDKYRQPRPVGSLSLNKPARLPPRCRVAYLFNGQSMSHVYVQPLRGFPTTAACICCK